MKKRVLFPLIGSLVLAVQATQTFSPPAKDLGRQLIEASKKRNTPQQHLLDLIARGAPVNTQCGLGGTALMYAAMHGSTGFVTALLDAGADVNVKSRVGCTALTYAAAYGHADTLQALLAAGADPVIANNDGKTALDLATTNTIQHMLTAAIHGSTTKAATKR